MSLKLANMCITTRYLIVQIKLADLDDIDDTQATCKQGDDCGIGEMRRLPCVKGRCQEYSDRLNVYHAYKLFYSLLPFKAPATVQRLLDELIDNTGKTYFRCESYVSHLK